MLLGLVNMAAVHPECAVRWEKPHLGQAGSYADATLENRIGEIREMAFFSPDAPNSSP